MLTYVRTEESEECVPFNRASITPRNERTHGGACWKSKLYMFIRQTQKHCFNPQNPFYKMELYSSVGKSHSQQEDFRAIDLLGFRPFFLPTMPIVFLSRCLLFSHGAGKISTSIKSRHFFLYFSRQYIIYYILYRRGLLSKHNTR